MVHPKRLNKIKLEDVIAIFTLTLNIGTTHLFEGFNQKNSLSL